MPTVRGRKSRAGRSFCHRFCKLLGVQSAGLVVRLSGGLAAWAEFWTLNQKCIPRKALGPKDECLVWLPSQAE